MSLKNEVELNNRIVAERERIDFLERRIQELVERLEKLETKRPGRPRKNAQTE